MRLRFIPALPVLLFTSLLPLGAVAQTGVWSPVGPAAVTIESLAVDPSNSSHLLAGTYFGGIYESNDGGAQWSHLDTVFGSYPVFSLIFDRQQPSVVFAGTFQAGIWKSTDAGKTWTQTSNGLTDFNVESIAIDPRNADVMIAVTGSRLLRSTDGAKSFVDITPALNGAISRVVAFDPGTSGRVFVGTLGSGVFISKDSGATWGPIVEGMGNRTITNLSFSDGGTPRLYAASSDGYGFELQADASVWTTLVIWPDGPRGPVNQVYPRPQSFGVLLASTTDGIYISRDDGITWYQSTKQEAGFIAADVFGTVLYACGLSGGLQSTVDLGKTWTTHLTGLQNVFIGGLFSSRDSSGSRLYAATEYGVFGGDSAVGPVWTPPGIGRHVFTVQGAPGDSATVFAGTESSGIWLTRDAGATWSPSYTGIVPQKIYALAASEAQPSVVYAGSSGGVYASSTGGRTWNPPGTVNIPTVLSIAIDPASSLTAYFGSLGGQIYKTTTAGSSVLLVFKTDDPADNITHLKVSPKVSNRVYATTASGYLVVTDDSGANWNLAGPENARVSAIDVDPSMPWKVYAGTVASGVYRSIDFGITWQPTGSSLTGTIYSLAVDPLHPATVYAGGDGSVYRSDDEGATWNDVTNGLTGGPVTTLIADTFASGTIYASIQNHGLFASYDGGATWQSATQNLPPDYSTAIALDPTTPGRLYATSESKGAYVSEDSAKTWNSSSTGMTLFVRGVAFDGDDANTVYAGSLLGGVFKSTDRGANWQPSGLLGKIILQVKTDPARSGRVFVATSDGVIRSTDGGATWSELGQKVGYIFSIAVDPADRRVVYVGGTVGQIFRTSDRGVTWERRNSGIPSGNVLSIAIDWAGNLYAVIQVVSGQASIYRSSDGGTLWNAVQIASTAVSAATRITVDAKAKVLFAATNGLGVLLSFDGLTWGLFNEGITSKIVTAVVGSPAKPGTAYAATLEQGVFISENGGPWRPVNKGLTSLALNDLAADPSVNGLLYAAGQDGLYRTVDGGVQWSKVNSGWGSDTPVMAITVDPFLAGVVYASTGSQLWKSSDKGESWNRADNNLPSTGIQAMQVGEDSTVVFAGLLGGGFVASSDAAQTWSSAANPTTITPFALCIALNPQNGSTVYAGTSAGVIRSTDGGDTWTSLVASYTAGAVIALAVDPAEPRVVFAGTSSGVYMTADGGETWNPILAGLFHRNVTALAVDAVNSRVVYAGTEGGGVFRYVRP